jgi:TolA-binding protein
MSRRVAEDLQLGDIYLNKRNYRGAEFRFEDALEYEPGNPEATFKLAQSLQYLGRKDEACTQYKKYLEADPSGAFSDRAKKSLQHAHALLCRPDCSVEIWHCSLSWQSE